MDIHINTPTPDRIVAKQLKIGSLATTEKFGQDCPVVMTWAGLASLDGQFFWASELLKDVFVTPLPSGTVITITV